MSEERKELRAQAEELGIKVDGRWSDEKLQAKIDEHLGGDEPVKGAKKYAPAQDGKFEILGVEITNGFTPSEAMAKSERFMAKLNHAVKCGVVNELTD